MIEANNKIYEFGEFRLIPAEGLLLRRGTPVNLNPKAFAMLTLLVEHHGHLVSKSEITDRIWEDTFVEEGVISKAVWFIRTALGDTTKERFIQTAPRRGYRFVAPVTVLNGDEESPGRSEFISTGFRLPADEAASGPNILSSTEEFTGFYEGDPPLRAESNGSKPSEKAATFEASDVPRLSFRWWPMIAVFIFGSLALSLYVNRPGILGRDEVIRVAVLPLKPLDAQNRDPLFELGISDQIISRLNAERKLAVRQLDSVRRYADMGTDAVLAGKEQDVDYVVSGSYHIANSRIKVMAQLLEVATGKVEVTYRIEKPLTPGFSVQDAIAADISSEVLAKFGARPVTVVANRGTDNGEAYKYYLLAMNLSEERGIQNLQKALEYLDRAVERDPSYARAWAEKAHMHIDIVGHTDSNQHEHYRNSMAAIQKASAIDPNLSEAVSALCYNKHRYEYDMEGAEVACKTAIQLDPNSPVAYKVYSHFLNSRGRSAEAIESIRTAMHLQPISFRNQQIYALGLYFARSHKEEEDQWRRLIELNPNHSYTYGRLAICLRQQGRDAEAFEYLIKKLTLDNVNAQTLERLKAEYGKSGWRGVNIERATDPQAQSGLRTFELACVYADLGDKERAFEALEKALLERSHRLAMLRVEPQLDRLRDDPRFEDLVRRVEGQKR